MQSPEILFMKLLNSPFYENLNFRLYGVHIATERKVWKSREAEFQCKSNIENYIFSETISKSSYHMHTTLTTKLYLTGLILSSVTMAKATYGAPSGLPTGSIIDCGQPETSRRQCLSRFDCFASY